MYSAPTSALMVRPWIKFSFFRSSRYAQPVPMNVYVNATGVWGFKKSRARAPFGAPLPAGGHCCFSNWRSKSSWPLCGRQKACLRMAHVAAI